MDHLRNELLQKGMNKYADDVESINKNLEANRKKQEDIERIKLEQEMIRIEKERIEQEKEKLRQEAEQLRKERELMLLTSSGPSKGIVLPMHNEEYSNLYKTNLQADIVSVPILNKSLSPPRKHINIVNKQVPVPVANTQAQWLIEEAERQRLAHKLNQQRLSSIQLTGIDQKLRRSVPNLINDPNNSKYINSSVSSSALVRMSQQQSTLPQPVSSTKTTQQQNRYLNTKPPTQPQRVLSNSQNDLQKNSYKQQQTNMQTISLNQKCSNCTQTLGQGSAMWIEKLGLAFHLKCFRCSVCNIALGNGKEGTDVRVSGANRLHCNNCFSNDLGNLIYFNLIYLNKYDMQENRNNYTTTESYCFKHTFTLSHTCKKYSHLKSKLLNENNYLLLPNYLSTRIRNLLFNERMNDQKN